MIDLYKIREECEKHKIDNSNKGCKACPYCTIGVFDAPICMVTASLYHLQGAPKYWSLEKIEKTFLNKEKNEKQRRQHE